MILPRAIDNTYRGQKLALWILGIMLLMRLVMGVNIMINGALVAAKADGIPLATYPPDAAQTIVALFKLLGVSHFMTAVIGIVVLVRYRGAVPLMFVTILAGTFLRQLIASITPIVRVGAPPAFAINLGFLVVTAVGLGLSLWPRKTAPSQAV